MNRLEGLQIFYFHVVVSGMNHGSVGKGGSVSEDIKMVHREGIKAPATMPLQQEWLKSRLLI